MPRLYSLEAQASIPYSRRAERPQNILSNRSSEAHLQRSSADPQTSESNCLHTWTLGSRPSSTNWPREPPPNPRLGRLRALRTLISRALRPREHALGHTSLVARCLAARAEVQAGLAVGRPGAHSSDPGGDRETGGDAGVGAPRSVIEALSLHPRRNRCWGPDFTAHGASLSTASTRFIFLNRSVVAARCRLQRPPP